MLSAIGVVEPARVAVDLDEMEKKKQEAEAQPISSEELLKQRQQAQPIPS